jgi:hypothetical protein
MVRGTVQVPHIRPATGLIPADRSFGSFPFGSQALKENAVVCFFGFPMCNCFYVVHGHQLSPTHEFGKLFVIKLASLFARVIVSGVLNVVADLLKLGV